MKTILIFMLSFLFIGLLSCEKETLIEEPSNSISVEKNRTVQDTIYGKWLLVDARMYVNFSDVMTPTCGDKVYYEHFSNERTISSLRHDGYYFPIEVIEKDKTVWEFKAPPSVPGTGEFILNEDYEHPMGFQVLYGSTSSFIWKIIEHPLTTNIEDMQLGGSARQFNAYSTGRGTITIQIQLVESSIGGYNCTYFNELDFVKIYD